MVDDAHRTTTVTVVNRELAALKRMYNLALRSGEPVLPFIRSPANQQVSIQ